MPLNENGRTDAVNVRDHPVQQVDPGGIGGPRRKDPESQHRIYFFRSADDDYSFGGYDDFRRLHFSGWG